MNPGIPDVMTIDDACIYLRIPRSSLYKLAQEGKIPCQKVGRHWRFRKVTLDRWLDSASINNVGSEKNTGSSYDR